MPARRHLAIGGALLGAAALLVVAGCGGGKTVAPLPETVVGKVPKPTVVKGNPAAGKQVFASAGCGACHVLGAAGAKGTVGPDLDEGKPALDLVLDRVRSGKGVMPAFSGQLSDKQIADVAAFVVESTKGG